ncbi:MAG: hypothetical protein H9W81_18405 [Enterococcus sp.]|nr:hypothetical protein [Enterococcus sp.]
MDAYQLAENALLRKYETLNDLSNTAYTEENKVRLEAKARGMGRALRALRTGPYQKPNYQASMEYSMNAIVEIMASTDDEAYRDGLFEGLRTIRDEYNTAYAGF